MAIFLFRLPLNLDKSKFKKKGNDSRHLRTSSKGKKVSSTWLLINSAFLALYTALAGFFIYKMYAHQFLAFRNIN
ncbi:hypothetical protein ACXWOK_09820, partial [Streptococcus pyogenes]